MTEQDNLRNWLTTHRDAVNIYGIEKALNLPKSTLSHFSTGRRDLPKTHQEALVKFLGKLGYKAVESENPKK